jgi:hypothetical protein
MSGRAISDPKGKPHAAREPRAVRPTCATLSVRRSTIACVNRDNRHAAVWRRDSAQSHAKTADFC